MSVYAHIAVFLELKNLILAAGQGLLIAGGAKWFRNRRLLTPAFHFEILKPYVQVYSDCTNILLVS